MKSRSQLRLVVIAVATALVFPTVASAQQRAGDVFLQLFNLGSPEQSTGGAGGGGAGDGSGGGSGGSGFDGVMSSPGCGDDPTGAGVLRGLLTGIGFADPTTADLFRFCDSMTTGGGGWTGQFVGFGNGDLVRRQQQGLAPDELFMQTDQAASLAGLQVGNVSQRMAQIKLARRGLGDLGGYAFERGKEGPTTFEGAFGLREPTVGNSRAIFEKALQRGFSAGDGLFGIQGLSGFINGQYTRIDTDRTRSETGSEGNGGGVTLGIDKQLGENAFLGFAFGYSRLNTDFDQNFGESDLDDYALSLYGSVFFAEYFYVDAIASGSILRFDQEREIPSGIPGTFNTLDSDPEGWNTTGDLGVGGEFNLKPVDLNPYVRVAVSYTDIDSFNESGSTLALSIDDQENTSVTSTVGLSVSLPVSTGAGVISPYVRGEYIHEYNDQADDIRGNLKLIPTASFKLEPNDTDRDYATAGGGVTATLGNGISAFADYDVVLGFSDLIVHKATLGGRLEF